MNNEARVIAYPGNRPPMLVSPPCDYRGAVWQYAPATPEEARRAIDVHDQHWPDWAVDHRLLALAGGETRVP